MVKWKDGQEHFCGCGGQCHQTANPCSFDCVAHHYLIDDWVYPLIEDGVPTKYGWIVKNKDNFRIGKYTDIGAFTYIQALYGVFIGDAVQVGSHVSIYSVSTINNTHGSVYLEKGCRIGSHSVIMPNVTVGEGATVGAFSYVDKDVPAGVMIHPVQKTIIKVREKRNVT